MKSLHHSFDVDLAAVYGVNEAIIIHHFQHWIRINRKRGANFHEDRTWSYQTLQDIADHFPYWTVEEVRTIVDRLLLGQNRRSKQEKEFEPVLIKGNFNKTAFDKTIWYAFIDEEKFVGSGNLRDNSNNSHERANAQIGTGDCPDPNGRLPRPIPDPLTDSKTKVVCYPTPVGPEIQIDLVSKIKKNHPDGHEVEISLDEIFKQAVFTKAKWTTDEIKEAWTVLCDYSGLVRDPLRFIEGTIENLKNTKKSQFLAKNKPNKGKEECTTEPIIQKSKGNSWADVSPEHPSLASLLAKQGLWP